MLNSNFKKNMIDGTFKAASTKLSSMILINGEFYSGSTSSTISRSDFYKTKNLCYGIHADESGNGMFLVFGKGTEEAKDSDYYLSNPYTAENSNLACLGVSCVNSDTTIHFTSIIANNGDSPVTISEIGLIFETGVSITIMLGRVVLDTPVTIPVGQSRSFTYEVA